MWLQCIDAEQTDFVSARQLSSTLALLGFTHWSHLEGVNCESLHTKNPVQSALLARAVVRASHEGRQIREASYDCGPSVFSLPLSSSVATLRCCANQMGEQLSPAQVLHAQDTWVATASNLNISFAGGTLSSTIRAAAKIDKEEAASLFFKRAPSRVKKEGRCVQLFPV